MESDTNLPKSTIEQILDTTFAVIEDQHEFDKETIKKLKELSKNNNFTKNTIIKAIRESLGGSNANT
jgi:hypothetical protein